mmetsp:Transcript_11170/g.26529  ORF Transcript_11170/g.26529 Transcript_11170/m.26529 type:complete len:220 (+) Transcript_11170:183-842(+)
MERFWRPAMKGQATRPRAQFPGLLHRALGMQEVPARTAVPTAEGTLGNTRQNPRRQESHRQTPPRAVGLWAAAPLQPRKPISKPTVGVALSLPVPSNSSGPLVSPPPRLRRQETPRGRRRGREAVLVALRFFGVLATRDPMGCLEPFRGAMRCRTRCRWQRFPLQVDSLLRRERQVPPNSREPGWAPDRWQGIGPQGVRAGTGLRGPTGCPRFRRMGAA